MAAHARGTLGRILHRAGRTGGPEITTPQQARPLKRSCDGGTAEVRARGARRRRVPSHCLLLLMRRLRYRLSHSGALPAMMADALGVPLHTLVRSPACYLHLLGFSRLAARRGRSQVADIVIATSAMRLTVSGTTHRIARIENLLTGGVLDVDQARPPACLPSQLLQRGAWREEGRGGGSRSRKPLRNRFVIKHRLASHRAWGCSFCLGWEARRRSWRSLIWHRGPGQKTAP